jgi:phytoene dehydrogenase-like protein
VGIECIAGYDRPGAPHDAAGLAESIWWACRSHLRILFQLNVRRLYFTGGSVHPGGGVPLVTLSGIAAAECVREDIDQSKSSNTSTTK